MHTRRRTTWLLYMIFTTFARADLLSMSTEIIPAKTTCVMKINEQITDITIDPLNLLHKLRQELITITNIKTSIKKGHIQQQKMANSNRQHKSTKHHHRKHDHGIT